jgi:hypothetical protein
VSTQAGSLLHVSLTGAFLLTVAVLAAATPATAQITPIFDPLTAPSSNFETPIDPDYQYGSNGLTRVFSDNGNVLGVDRPLVKTVATNFNGCSFVYDLTVETDTSINAEDLIFIGFGQGTTNVLFFNEPTDSFFFRIHNGVVGNRVDAAANSGQGTSEFSFTTIGTYDPAGTTFEIVCVDNQVSFSIVGQPLSGFTLPIAAVPGLTSSNSHLFFTNTAVGSTFSDFFVTPSPPTSKDQCKNGGWRTFGIFKNQGDCVSFVATGGKNQPAR